MSTQDAFHTRVHELQHQCRALSAAVAAGQPDRIATIVREVASTWLTAKATLEAISGPCTFATGAHVLLCAAHSVMGQLFRGAFSRLGGGTAPESCARATLRELGAALAIAVDPGDLEDAMAADVARVRPAVPMSPVLAGTPSRSQACLTFGDDVRPTERSRRPCRVRPYKRSRERPAACRIVGRRDLP